MFLKRLAKDSVIYGGADIISKLIAFLTFPLIAAALSPKAFGTLELIGTTISLLGLFVNCGLNNATQRFYWDTDTTPVQQPVIVSTGFAVQVCFSLSALIIGLVCIPFVYPHVLRAELPVTWVALLAALATLVSNQALTFILDVIRLHFRPGLFFTTSLLSRVLGAVLGVFVVVSLGWGVDGLLSVQALVGFAVLPLAIFFIRKDITRQIDKSWAWEMVRFGYPFIFASVAYWLFGSMDRWMLASMTSVEEVGIYSVAFRFGTLVLFVSAAFGQAWSPVAIKIRTDDPEGYKNTYVQVLFLLLYVMLFVGGGVALFSGEGISLFMPEAYASSALPLSILCFGIVLQSTQQVTAIGISLEKKTYLFARLAWFTAFINFALNWVLIPMYGAVGAASATFFSYLILTGSYLVFTQRLHPLPIPWKRLLFFLFLGSGVGFVAVFFNTTIFSWTTIGLKAVVGVICMALGWIALPLRRFHFGT